MHIELIKPDELCKIVGRLNDEFNEQMDWDFPAISDPFELRSNGCDQVIRVFGAHIWDSVDDPREYYESEECNNPAYEDMEIFLRNKINYIISQINEAERF
jgi:hypothetical protein